MALPQRQPFRLAAAAAAAANAAALSGWKPGDVAALFGLASGTGDVADLDDVGLGCIGISGAPAAALAGATVAAATPDGPANGLNMLTAMGPALEGRIQTVLGG